MSDESTNSPKSTSPASAPTATGNQNLIIGLVLGAVVLLLFLLVLQMTAGGLGSGSSGSSEVEKLKDERDALLAKRSGVSVAGASSPSELADRLRQDSQTLAGLVTQLQTALAQSRTDLDNARSAFNLASRDAEQLRQQLSKAQIDASEVPGLRQGMADAQALQAQAETRAADLLNQLNAAKANAGDLATLRAQHSEAVDERNRLQQELAALQAQMQGLEPKNPAADQELATLRERVSALSTENNQLHYEIQELRANLDRTRLFAEKVDELPTAAKALYVELSNLESASPAELQDAYKRIEQELKAAPIDTIKFQTGSPHIDRDKVEEIRRTVQAAPDDSYFLVVGYASKSGGLETNRQLSSERATTIASVADRLKKGGQGVQAVFLSETARFSSAQEVLNQVCEIWEIRK